MLAGALALVAPLAAFAQNNAARPLITDRVDNARLTTLSGNTHPLARVQYDQGAAPPDLPMNRILLVLKRSADQESALQDLLLQQQVTSSPTYHKWLTPAQFGQQFGPADADIQAVTSWLASFGFQSIKVSNGRTVIEFSGTASQLEAALHTQIHKYVVNGESHWANAGDPQIPAALAPVVSGFVSLHNFHAKPTLHRSGRTVTATVTPGTNPQITLNTSRGTLHALVPGDFNTIYNVAPTMTGAGVTIGVVASSNINVQDVASFRSMFLPGLAANNPQIILNGPDPGDTPGSQAEGEAVLDATWAGSVAPAATVDLVVSEDTNAVAGSDLSELYIIDDNLADIMTESFGACEAVFSANANYYNIEAEQAAAQGITYLVSSGDAGPDTCDDQTTIPANDHPASVNILASTPYTVAVGGTMFNDTASPSTYWNATNAANGTSAKSYIPENAWNESCTALSANCVIVGLWSSGGGQSTLFSKPPWQAGVAGIPSANSRFLPDVAMDAADHDGYLLCIDGSCQGSNVQFAIASGTSASVQVFGGVMALVVQKMGGARQGIANYELYKLAATETLSSCNGSSTTLPISTCIFNDTTVGNTNIPGETGFIAGLGYDETTGLGSVNVSNLVNQWHTAVVTATTTTLTLNNGNPVNAMHGTGVPVGITVKPVPPATGTPTGDVSLVANSTTGQGADFFTLSGGSVSSATNKAFFLPGGNYQVKAHYEGDGTFLGSDSASVTVTITPESSLTTMGIVVNPANCGTATSITYGSPYILSAAVVDLAFGGGNVCLPAPSAGIPTGTVTLTDKFNGVTSPLDGGAFKLNSNGYFEDQTIQLPAGAHTITAAYGGDNSFLSSSSSPDVVTVSQAATTASVMASQTTVPPNTSVTLTATVATQSNATANASQEPNGTLQFFDNGTAFSAPVAVIGGVNSTTFFAQATATISTSSLVGGQNVITAKYLGDSNYAASATSPSVTVTVTSPTVTTSSLPTGLVNSPYPSTQLTASGGATPYTWTVTAGSLPAGLAPLPSTGIISGTPTTKGTSNFTVQVKDAVGNTNTAALSITINASLQVTTTTVPTDVDAGVAYTATTLTATGGTSPYTWAVNSGSLPAGLTLSNAGVISGTPIASAVGMSTFTVKVTDSQNNFATSGSLTIAVSGFNFTAASISPITVSSPGMSGTGLITLNVVNGFTGTATLTANVTGSPTGAVDLPVPTFTTPDSNFNTANNTMTFTNAVLTGNVTLNIATTAASGTAFRRPNGPAGRALPLAATAISLAGFLFLLAVQKQRRWGFVPLVALLVVVVVAGVSCGTSSGGGGGGGGGNKGTTTGTYMITVVATPAPGGTQAAQTAIIQVIVN
jgi:subtilase family serine protease